MKGQCGPPELRVFRVVVVGGGVGGVVVVVVGDVGGPPSDLAGSQS